MEALLVPVGPGMVLGRKNEACELEGIRVNDQNVPMSQTECSPRYFYLPDVLYQSYPLPNYLRLNAMLIWPHCPVYPHHLSFAFALHRQRNIQVFITKSPPKFELPLDFQRIFNPKWRPGLTAVCKTHHLKQFDFLTQQHHWRKRIVFHFVAKILYKFLKVHPWDP